MEFVEEFYQANFTKPNQATLGGALRKAAAKETRRKAKAVTVHQGQEAYKRKAKEALAGRPKNYSKMLQDRV
jgi:hypothetical protein